MSSSLAKNINAIPRIVGTKAGKIASVFMKIPIPIIIPVIPIKIFSLAMVVFVFQVNKCLEWQIKYYCWD